ncbi:hypothetical protein N7462_004306 [Penicillium macrosclerotiorum]|uniref:uncharacterized protein n=1 Tax=Penicillium macrosclerotiorum TaxID=303699 RepID=UPI002547F51F|nr:uncharacterized protein N7462_004306 [Penicillium macrosclerotiorum]KAJ5689914.1 hypothetical protein N7462_004306 [Penicillium macrosclerotiorum]
MESQNISEKTSSAILLEESSVHLDPASRRKLQNRLNQRASRKRKALQAAGEPKRQGRRWVVYTNEATAATSSPEDTGISSSAVAKKMRQETCQSISQINDKSSYPVAPHMPHDESWAQLQQRVNHAVSNGFLTPTLVPLFTQYNVMLAMFNNAASMGLTGEVLCEDIASFFNIPGPFSIKLPPSLQPTSAQKQVIHHPWIDLLPMRSLRDTLLYRLGTYDEDELCGDLYGLCSASPSIGLFVWGESWDPAAYEVSESVLRKWEWLFKECPDLLASTNHWRRKRGEKPLKLIEFRHSSIEKINQ